MSKCITMSSRKSPSLKRSVDVICVEDVPEPGRNVYSEEVPPTSKKIAKFDFKSFKNAALCKQSEGCTTSSASGQDATRTYIDEAVEITPNQWHHFDSIQEALNEHNGVKLRENGHLLVEKLYPLNKSGTKLAVVGVNPLMNYRPEIKLVKSDYSQIVTFTVDEYETFISRLPELLRSQGNVQYGKKLCEVGRYDVNVLQHDIFHVCLKTDVSQNFGIGSVYLAGTTLTSLMGISRFLRRVLEAYIVKQNHIYPDYEMFVTEIADVLHQNTEIRDVVNIKDEIITAIIDNKYAGDFHLYELLLKFGDYLRKDVTAKMVYMMETNRYY